MDKKKYLKWKEFFEELPRSTKTLELHNKNLESAGLRALAEANHLDSLHTLDLSVNKIGAKGMVHLRQAKFLASLKSLNLGHNVIGDDGIAELRKANRLDSLRSLNLESNQLGGKGILHLMQSQHLESIQELNLRGNLIRANAMRHFQRAKNFTSLKFLNLADNKIGTSSMAYMQQSKHLTLLNHLDLERNLIGVNAMVQLRYGKQLASLEYLNLADNEIGNEGVFQLRQANHMDSLIWLNLAHNKIGVEGITELLKAKNLDSLQSLNLAYNKIGDDEVKSLLQSMKQLTEVDFRKCGISAGDDLCTDVKALRDYFRIGSLVTESLDCRLRVFLIGPAEVGKTTLFKRLTDQSVELGKQARTQGFDRVSLQFKSISNVVSGKTLDTEIDLWDMGGHSLQHMCHGLFFEPETLYVLVCSETMGSDATTHWMEILREKCPPQDGRRTQILPVWNAHHGSVQPRLGDFDWFEPFRRVFDWESMVSVDLGNDDRKLSVSTLENRLIEKLEQYEFKTYWSVIDDLKEPIAALEEPYYVYAEFCRKVEKMPGFVSGYEAVAKQYRVAYQETLDQDKFLRVVVDVLSTQGIVHNIASINLIIRDPQWAEKGMYAMLPPEDDHSEVLKTHRDFVDALRTPDTVYGVPGLVSQKDMTEYLIDLGFREYSHNDLLRLLTARELGLMMGVNSTDGIDRYWIPAYLDELSDDKINTGSLINDLLKKASHCEVIERRTKATWPRNFLYQYLVWVACAVEDDGDVVYYLSRRGEHRDPASHFQVSLEKLTKGHCRLTLKSDRQAVIDLVLHKHQLWVLLTTSDSSYDTQEIMQRLYLSIEAMLRTHVTRERWDLERSLPCPSCLERSAQKRGIAEIGFFDAYEVYRSRGDYRLTCPADYLHKPTASRIKNYLVQRNAHVLPSSSDDNVATERHASDTVLKATVVVGLFLLDTGRAQESSQSEHSRLKPLCVQGTPEKKTWKNWVENKPESSQTYGTLKGFVISLVSRFHEPWLWANMEGPRPAKPDDLVARHAMVLAANAIKEDPKGCDELATAHGSKRSRPSAKKIKFHQFIDSESYPLVIAFLNSIDIS